MTLNNSPARWPVLPVLPEAKLSCPGRALASAINSRTFFAGTEGADHQHVGHRGHQRDRRKVAQRVVRHFGIQIRIDRVRAHRAHEQGVAIRRAFRHIVGTDVAARAGAIVDNDRLLPGLRQLLTDGACCNIERPARRKRHDKAYGFYRVVLRVGSGHGEQCRQAETARCTQGKPDRGECEN